MDVYDEFASWTRDTFDSLSDLERDDNKTAPPYFKKTPRADMLLVNETDYGKVFETTDILYNRLQPLLDPDDNSEPTYPPEELTADHVQSYVDNLTEHDTLSQPEQHLVEAVQEQDMLSYWEDEGVFESAEQTSTAAEPGAPV